MLSSWATGWRGGAATAEQAKRRRRKIRAGVESAIAKRELQGHKRHGKSQEDEDDEDGPTKSSRVGIAYQGHFHRSSPREARHVHFEGAGKRSSGSVRRPSVPLMVHFYHISISTLLNEKKEKDGN